MPDFAIEDTGAAPYVIEGDPVTALIAQLNRFAGKRIKTGGERPQTPYELMRALVVGATRIGCGEQVLLTAPLPLIPSLDTKGALTAALIVWLRYACSPLFTTSTNKEKWAFAGLKAEPAQQWAFVMNNLKEITITIAQYGDTQGLPAAEVGIKERDPLLVPDWKFPTTPALLGLSVGVLASFVTSRIRRAR